jgi:hypothetical protein
LAPEPPTPLPSSHTRPRPPRDARGRVSAPPGARGSSAPLNARAVPRKGGTAASGGQGWARVPGCRTGTEGTGWASVPIPSEPNRTHAARPKRTHAPFLGHLGGIWVLRAAAQHQAWGRQAGQQRHPQKPTFCAPRQKCQPGTITSGRAYSRAVGIPPLDRPSSFTASRLTSFDIGLIFWRPQLSSSLRQIAKVAKVRCRTKLI